MSHYPLFFTYRDRIFGNGFLADVMSHGRILAAEEDGDVWVYGVEPGGMAACGATPKEALEAFRLSFTQVLSDLAAEASTFEAFRESVRGFFHEVNEPTEQDWLTAVAAVQKGDVDLPGTPREIAAEAKCSIDVDLKEQASFSPKDNEQAILEPALAA